MAKGLAEGLKNNAALAKSAARSVALDMLNAAKLTLDIHSPSGEFEKIGLNSDKGLPRALRRIPVL